MIELCLKFYIEEALKRGVKITFSYGMEKDDDIDKKSKDFFYLHTTEFKSELRAYYVKSKATTKIIAKAFTATDFADEICEIW